jgi:hypothetical protein
VGSVVPLGNGLYHGVYIPVLKRNNQTVTNNKQWQDVIVSLGVSGSLLATYYHSSNPDTPVVTTTVSLTASSTPPAVTAQYNARYLGFVRPPLTSWIFSVSSSTGSISVGINGKSAVLTGVGATTLTGTVSNALYDINISVTNGAAGSSPVISLNLEGSFKNLVAESARVFQRHDLAFKVFDSSGLLATFYNSGSFGSPSTIASVPNIDWSYSTNSARYHPSVASAGNYGVRWTGFVMPTMNDVYTLFFQKSSGESDVQVWFDNGSPWTITTSEASSTVFVQANQLYEITVRLMSSNSASAMYRLLWENRGDAYLNYDKPAATSTLPKTVIGLESFFRIRSNSRVVRDDQSRYYDTEAGWPRCGSISTGDQLEWFRCRGQGLRSNDVLSVEVEHAVICGSTSSITISDAVSSITAGATGTFNLVVRDRFSNVLDSDTDAILIKITLNSESESPFYGSVIPSTTGTTVGDPKGAYSVSYVVTRAGTFSLTIAAVGAYGNGLRGTFFRNRHFTDPSETLASPSINFNWGMGIPAAGLNNPSGWSVRWTGFIRLVDSASTMYSFFLRTGHGGGRLYVGEMLVIDSISESDENPSGGEVSGTISLTSNVVYDVTVEYVAASAPAHVVLSYSSYSQARVVIPSSALFPISSIFSNGAQTLSVVDFRRNCGASSLVSGSGLSIATAGISASFTITSIDQYGNVRQSQSVNPDCNDQNACVFATVAVPDDASTTIRPFRGRTTLQNTNAYFSVAYTITRSAGYSILVSSSPVAQGLWATYYDDIGWRGPVLSQIQSNPTWTISDSSDIPPALVGVLSKDTLWSVRFMGSYKPTQSGNHIFSFTVTEKIKAYVDGALVADTYTTGYSGGAITVSSTINFPDTNTFYDIHIMYETDSSTGSTFGATINGEQYSTRAANLYSSNRVSATPSRNIVYPNVPCGTASTIRGAALSLATAGVLASFTLTLRDAYGNLRDAADGLVIASAFPLTGSYITPSPNMYQGVSHTGTCASCPVAPVRGLVTKGSSGELYNVQITLTKTGNYKISASIARPGGLSATYYTRDASAFQFNGAVSSRMMFGSLDYTTTVTVSSRWQGYLRPSRAGSYTFSVEPYSASEGGNFKLWISQSLVIDRTVAIPSTGFSAVYSFPYADNLYDVFVAYHSPSPVTAAGFRLYWQSAQVPGKNLAGDTQKEKIPTQRLYYRDDIDGSYIGNAAIKVTVQADVGSARTFASGNGLTVATAGAAGSFSITSRDTFDNSRTTNDLSVSAAIFSSDGFPVSATLTLISCSGVCSNRVSYTLTRSGSYFVTVYDRAFVVCY